MTVFQQQGPADRCVIHGQNLGWKNCTACAAAMGIDWATLGNERPSGCTVRRGTRDPQTGGIDITGGLMLSQVEPVIEAFGVAVQRKVSTNYATPGFVADRMAIERRAGAIVQGNTKALLNTVHESTAGAVNHAVWVERPSQWATVSGLYRPRFFRVFDPAADGRLDFAQGPQTWSWETLWRFAGALRPWGDDDPRVLGPGKMWSAWLTQWEPDEEEDVSNWAPGLPFACTVKVGTKVYDEDGKETGTTITDATKPYMVTGESADGLRWEIAGAVSKPSPKRFVPKSAVKKA